MSAARWLAAAGALLGAFWLGTVVGGVTPGGPTAVQGGPTAVHAEDAAHAETVWTCSMHPAVQRAEPGTCPICGMELVPVDVGAPAGDASGAGVDAPVMLSERAAALARLRTTIVARATDPASEVRLLGRVEPAETGLYTVTAWVGGRIDDLRVAETGARVRRGEVTATVYSPELYAAQQDLIAARRQVERLGDDAGTRSVAEAALGAARARVRLLGVPEDVVDELAAAAAPSEHLSIRSPGTGTVLERLATEGQYVTTGTPLYRVADLSTVWVQLDAYEVELPRLAVGQAVAITTSSAPGVTFEGRVDFLEPVLDARRRTSRLRVVVDNAEGRLRPGVFVEAVVDAHLAADDRPLVIPATSALFTGDRSLVYVEVPGTHGLGYAPREVVLGPRLGDVLPVVSGLEEGERVVSRGAFVLDADLQLRGGASMMGGAVAADMAGPPLPDLAPVLEAYLGVQRALAEDDLPAASAAAEVLGAAVAGVGVVDGPWGRLARTLSAEAGRVAGAEAIDVARRAFEPLSAAAQEVLARFGNPLSEPVSVAFCPMALGGGARWVQTGAAIDNAYYGDVMRTCGELEHTVAPGERLRDVVAAGRGGAPR